MFHAATSLIWELHDYKSSLNHAWLYTCMVQRTISLRFDVWLNTRMVQTAVDHFLSKCFSLWCSEGSQIPIMVNPTNPILNQQQINCKSKRTTVIHLPMSLDLPSMPSIQLEMLNQERKKNKSAHLQLLLKLIWKITITFLF